MSIKCLFIFREVTLGLTVFDQNIRFIIIFYYSKITLPVYIYIYLFFIT